jgi:hypothetical protein
MAQKTVRVKPKDIIQGKTFWQVYGHIQTVHHSSFVAERIKRYPNKPSRWYSDDEWGRASVDAPQRIFIESNETVKFHRGWLTNGSPLTAIFFKQNDAQAYYDQMSAIVVEKRAVLEARFPANINPPKAWPGAGKNIVVAHVDIASHDTDLETRANIQQQFKLNHQ